MDSTVTVQHKQNPRYEANILSKSIFWYTRGLFKKGLKRELEETDLYEVDPDFDAAKIGDYTEKQWNLNRKSKYAMLWVFWNMVGKFYILIGLTETIVLLYEVAVPLLIGKIVSYFQPDQTHITKFEAALYGISLMLLQLLLGVYKSNYDAIREVLSIKFQTGVCSLFYRKFLKMSASRTQNIPFGKISNLITKDINSFNRFFYGFNQAWIGIVACFLLCYNMYQRIGSPALIAVVAYIIFLPLPLACSLYMKTLKRNSSEKTDIRINILEEALSTIRSTKMYVWEKHIEEKINLARKKEMSILFKLLMMLYSILTSAILLHNLALYLLLILCIWLGTDLNSDLIYFITGSFIGLSYFLSILIPYAAFYYAQIMVGLERIQAIMKELEETDEQTTDIIPNLMEHELQLATNEITPHIQFKDASIGVLNENILNDINFELENGLTLITGAASSGKTVFLLSILREFEIKKGSVQTSGKISYASQEPWLFPSTLRQNILFGSPYDPKRYSKVIKTCALDYDFNLMANGDLTVVSERGINLSKGQQTRINLARAIYRDSDIYLLDDCLSSLDALVAWRLFSNCILQLLQDKLVIFVTNDYKLFQYANSVITVSGTTCHLTQNLQPNTLKLEYQNESFELNASEELDENEDKSSDETKLITKQKKMYSEIKQSGAIPLGCYKACIKLGGGYLIFGGVVLLYIASQIAITFKDKEINNWSNLEERITQTKKIFFNMSGDGYNLTLANPFNITSPKLMEDVFWEQRKKTIYMYSASVIGLCLSTLLRVSLLFIFTKRVSTNLHKKMLASIVNAKLSFFGTTFVGNIVNRFTRDLVIMDENIPFLLNDVISLSCETFGVLLLISIKNIKFLATPVVLLVCILILRWGYIKIGRALQRLDASTKSPVLGYLKSTWEGLASIKAFDAEKVLSKEFIRCQNMYTSAAYWHNMCLSAFLFGVHILLALFIGATLLQFFVFDTGTSSADVGLILSQSYLLTKTLSFVIRRLAELETQFTSIERAVEYTTIQQESKAGMRPNNWPNKAGIIYKNVNLSINNISVLKDINFTIDPKQKIGVVGRTGAGKSSLISVLFHLCKFEGLVTIDGIDIKTIALDYLRSHISVIPQDMIMLSCTIRHNIDPEEKNNDDEIWKAINTVKLAHLIPSLDMNIKELDFSCGQKQLLSLARVLVNKTNRILVLDEMVEKVDEQTESLVNDIIETHFDSCTVIKIAHKLKFVLNCDKILVMEKGTIAEFNQPSILLQDKNSLFSKMYKTSMGTL